MAFVAQDHTIVFAIDAAAKASVMQQMDQNIDDHETRIVKIESGNQWGFIVDPAWTIITAATETWKDGKTFKVYIPTDATTLEYIGFVKGDGTWRDQQRLRTSTNNGGSMINYTSTYAYKGPYTLDVSDKSGWTDITVEGISNNTGIYMWLSELFIRLY